MATNLVRVVQGKERHNEGILNERLANRLKWITNMMMDVIEDASLSE